MDCITNEQTLVEQFGVEELTTEAGAAKALVSITHQDYKYSPDLGGWLVWNGVRWAVDQDAIYHEVAALGQMMLEQAAKEPRNIGDRLYHQGRYLQSDRGAGNIIAWAERDTRIKRSADDFDSDPLLFNTLSGTVDLHTGQVRNHRREDFITKLSNVAYDSDSPATHWHRFIEVVLPDPEVRRYIQKTIGLSLTGTTPEQSLYINHGTGANGKSTFFDAIYSMMGNYAGIIDIEMLMERHRTGGPTPEIMFLMGKRMVIASESKAGDHLNEAKIKQMTGDENLTGRNPYGKQMVTFERQFKLFMHANHRPEITGTDHAIWRRPKLIPWNVTIPEDKRDKQLLGKLKWESSAILNWAIQGYQLYQAEGLIPPKAVQAATEQYRDDMNKVGQFIKDRCYTSEDQIPGLAIEEPYVTKDALYQAYQSWCDDNGVYSEKKRRFGERMADLGYDKNAQKKINGTNHKVWKGVGLLSNAGNAQNANFSI